MEHTDFQDWLDAYIEAWETYDEAAIGELFSADARYRYHPWEVDDAVQGRDAIVTNWLEDRDEPSLWTAEYRPWAIDGDRAVAAGVSRYLSADGRSSASTTTCFSAASTTRAAAPSSPSSS